MKKNSIYALILVISFFACDNDPMQPTTVEDIPDSQLVTSNGSNLRTASEEFSDWSGQVKIKLFYAYTSSNPHNTIAVQVDADYVLVGGAAWVQNTEWGAFLTESRPNLSSNTWYAASKDHINSDPHTLHVVAIGLRLEGVTSDVLKSYMQIYQATGNTNSHPIAAITIPQDYILLGGGAKVNLNGGWGNLLVHSYPDGNTWRAKSKDHIKANPVSITAYAIGIRNVEIPGFGYLESAISNLSNTIPNGTSTVTTTIPSGWIISCSGGRTTFNSSGRMLMGMKVHTDNPYNCDVTSKDHKRADGGDIWAYAVRIRKKP